MGNWIAIRLISKLRVKVTGKLLNIILVTNRNNFEHSEKKDNNVRGPGCVLNMLTGPGVHDPYFDCHFE